jgi:hypothetical protein
MSQAAAQAAAKPQTSFLWKFTHQGASSDMLVAQDCSLATGTRSGLTNLSRVVVVTRPLDKDQQFVSRCLEALG